MIRRLKIKFVCVNMLIVTVMLTVIFGQILVDTSRNIEEESYRQLQMIHIFPSHRGNFKSEQRRAPFFVVTFKAGGETELHSRSFFEYAQESELLEIAQKTYDGNERRGILKEHNLRFSRRTVRDGEQIVFMDISLERSVLSGLYKTCTWIAVVSFFSFLAISILLAQWAVRPVEKAWNSQRQFVADASHELKTPLTVIMTNAELLQDDSLEEETKNQFAMNILAMSRQMRGLVEGLLDLSRVDNGIVKSVFSDINFTELISDCILPFEPLFFEKGMELHIQVAENVELRGSESHLRQVADILLDNAIKYGSEEKPVEVSLVRQGRYAVFSVATSGDELSSRDLKNVFRRFYRANQARPMNGSYGLGLSIAESIVKEHRGKIWAESRNGRNTFYVQLKTIPQRNGRAI